jgi:hypothetical protein
MAPARALQTLLAADKKSLQRAASSVTAGLSPSRGGTQQGRARIHWRHGCVGHGLTCVG